MTPLIDLHLGRSVSCRYQLYLKVIAVKTLPHHALPAVPPSQRYCVLLPTLASTQSSPNLGSHLTTYFWRILYNDAFEILYLQLILDNKADSLSANYILSNTSSCYYIIKLSTKLNSIFFVINELGCATSVLNSTLDPLQLGSFYGGVTRC